MTQRLVYAGIGSRETPEDVIKVMVNLGKRLAELGFVLRSGAADGADKAFEQGCDQANAQKEIFLPWAGFNRSKSSRHAPTNAAMKIASQFHPNWKNCSEPAKLLHSRNVHQILGQDLNSPVRFVICWTQDGCESTKDRSQRTGGTGQAISIADNFNIPVINLYHENAMSRLHELVELAKSESFVEQT